MRNVAPSWDSGVCASTGVCAAPAAGATDGSIATVDGLMPSLPSSHAHARSPSAAPSRLHASEGPTDPASASPLRNLSHAFLLKVGCSRAAQVISAVDLNQQHLESGLPSGSATLIPPLASALCANTKQSDAWRRVPPL